MVAKDYCNLPTDYVFALFPRDAVGAVIHHVENAQSNLGLGKNRLNSLGEAIDTLIPAMKEYLTTVTGTPSLVYLEWHFFAINKAFWTAVTQSVMRSLGVIVLPPIFNHYSYFTQV